MLDTNNKNAFKGYDNNISKEQYNTLVKRFNELKNYVATILPSLELPQAPEDEVVLTRDVGYDPTWTVLKTINGQPLLGRGNIVIKEGSDDVGKAILDVEKLPTSGWKGTPVPNSGYVEKVYINTNLTTEEVVALIKDLPFTYYDRNDNIFPDYYVYRGYGSDNNMLCIVFSNNVYYILDRGMSEYFIEEDKILFCSSSDDSEVLPGWGMLEQRIQNGDYTNPIEVNDEVSSSFNTSEHSGVVFMGTENEKLSSLFSITPFEYVGEESIKKEIIYRTPDSRLYEWGKNVTKEEGKYVGTPIPTNGYIDKLYFNTKLSGEEVVNIISNLPYEEGMFPLFMYPDGSEYAFISIYHMSGIMTVIGKSNNADDIMIEENIIFAYSPVPEIQAEFPFNFTGWNPNINGVFEVASNWKELTNEQIAIFDENFKKISNLVSITEFEFVEGGEKVNEEFVEITSHNSYKTLETNYSYEGKGLKVGDVVKTLYFNTELQTSEVDKVLAGAFSATDAEPTFFKGVDEDNNEIYISGGWTPGSSNDFNMDGSMISIHGQPYLEYGDENILYANGLYAIMSGISGFNKGSSFTLLKPITITEVHENFHLLDSIISINEPFEKIETRKAIIESKGTRIYPKTDASQVEGLPGELAKKQDNLAVGYGLKITKNLLEHSVIITDSRDWSVFDRDLYDNICGYLVEGLTVYVMRYNDGSYERLPIIQINGGQDWSPFDSVNSFTIQEIKDGKMYLHTWSNGAWGDGEVTTQVIGDSSVITNIGNVTNEGYKGNMVVPNNGAYIQYINFNTKLSKEEVNAVLRELTYTQTELVQAPICPILFSSHGSPIIFAEYNPNTLLYAITIVTDITNSTFEYAYNSISGWQIENKDYLIESSVLPEYNGITIGEQNDKLVNIISVGGFTKIELKENTLYRKDNNKLYYVSNGKLVEISDEEGTIVANVGANGTYHFPDNMIELLRSNKVKKIILSNYYTTAIYNSSGSYTIEGTDGYKIETYMFGSAFPNGLSVLELGVVDEQLVSNLVESTIYDQFNLELDDGEGVLELDVRSSDGNSAITKTVPVSTTTLNGESHYLATDAAAKNYVDEKISDINRILESILGEEE